jgi:U3 small nucleolar RNA-associated protein 19
MIQHPGLRKMVHRDEGQDEVEEDPFLPDEQDPFRTRALESTLWEIKTLQKHPVPAIAAHAHFIERPLPKIEKDLDETLDYTYSKVCELIRDMFQPLPIVALLLSNMHIMQIFF